jgi:hypothetical protein
MLIFQYVLGFITVVFGAIAVVVVAIVSANFKTLLSKKGYDAYFVRLAEHPRVVAAMKGRWFWLVFGLGAGITITLWAVTYFWIQSPASNQPQTARPANYITDATVRTTLSDKPGPAVIFGGRYAKDAGGKRLTIFLEVAGLIVPRGRTAVTLSGAEPIFANSSVIGVFADYHRGDVIIDLPIVIRSEDFNQNPNFNSY